MRRIYLLFSIVGLISISVKLHAQWEKMPIGTKLYYKYQYSIYRYNLNDTEDTITSIPSIKCIRLDTIMTLSDDDRKLVLFSDIVDPYGSVHFGVPTEFEHISDKDLYDKDKCSLFYFFKDAVYAIEVSKRIKILLRNPTIVKALNDSLKMAVYYSATDTTFNYWAMEKKEDKAQFTVGGYKFVFQQFKLLKGEKYRKVSDVYTLGNDAYNDFYGLRSKESDSTDLYLFAGGKWVAKLIYSPRDGIIFSDAFAGGRSDEVDLKMKLQKIEYPNPK